MLPGHNAFDVSIESDILSSKGQLFSVILQTLGINVSDETITTAKAAKQRKKPYELAFSEQDKIALTSLRNFFTTEEIKSTTNTTDLLLELAAAWLMYNSLDTSNNSTFMDWIRKASMMGLDILIEKAFAERMARNEMPKPDINQPSQTGRSALHFAIGAYKIKTANALIRLGANPRQETPEGDDAFALAHKNGVELTSTVQTTPTPRNRPTTTLSFSPPKPTTSCAKEIELHRVGSVKRFGGGQEVS